MNYFPSFPAAFPAACLAVLALAVATTKSHAAAKLINGPMLTTSTMNEVVIWTQTSGPALVRIEYWPEDSDGAKRSSSASYQTERDTANVAKVRLDDELVPGQRYAYEVFVDGYPQSSYYRNEYKDGDKIPTTFQVKPRWRFVPSEDSRHSIFDFRIAAGSCNYINETGYDREGGAPYGSNYRIFESIYEKSPDLMLWLGDNVYYRENDFESRSGMIHRWTHDRAIPELRPLLANTHHFATWDDHDYGPNDIGRSYTLKGEAKEIFDLFWSNPSSGLPETGGIFTFINWGDANIYLLDNRTFLSTAVSNPAPEDEPKTVLGKEQLDWLVNHLIWAQSQMASDSHSYPARFNIICVGNQFLSDAGNPHAFRNFPADWEYLMDRIAAEGIEGVVFLSGDVHFGEVSKYVYPNTGDGPQPPPIYEITTSPLTAGVYRTPPPNSLTYDLFEGDGPDRVLENNFVTLDFKGPLTNRRMEIRYFNADGELLNRKLDGAPDEITENSIIFANDLKVK